MTEEEGARPQLVLASGSPRRRQLLEEVGLSLLVLPADADEARLPGEEPRALVERLARLKAQACVAAHPDEVAGHALLAADTIVWTPGGEAMGKPASEEDARRMLASLSGAESRVSTGVALSLVGADGLPVAQTSFVETTRVLFWDLTQAEVEAYVASGEPMDKAGAYGIQGRGRLLVRGIEGDYFNVVGLPVGRAMRELGRLEEAAGWREGHPAPGASLGSESDDAEEALVARALEGSER